MDHAVSLVQAYLQLNGYFTSAEYPIIASAGRSGVRTITDIDVLAFRFPSGSPVPEPRGRVSTSAISIREEGGVEVVESTGARRPHSAPRHLRRPRYGRHRGK